jgi:hypothetical protein
MTASPCNIPPCYMSRQVQQQLVQLMEVSEDEVLHRDSAKQDHPAAVHTHTCMPCCRALSQLARQMPCCLAPRCSWLLAHLCSHDRCAAAQRQDVLHARLALPQHSHHAGNLQPVTPTAHVLLQGTWQLPPHNEQSVSALRAAASPSSCSRWCLQHTSRKTAFSPSGLHNGRHGSLGGSARRL